MAGGEQKSIIKGNNLLSYLKMGFLIDECFMQFVRCCPKGFSVCCSVWEVATDLGPKSCHLHSKEITCVLKMISQSKFNQLYSLVNLWLIDNLLRSCCGHSYNVEVVTYKLFFINICEFELLGWNWISFAGWSCQIYAKWCTCKMHSAILSRICSSW